MKMFSTPFLTITLSLILTACTAVKPTTPPVIIPEGKENITEPRVDMKKCVCVQLWMPVCGENGKTYSNACFANCAGVKFTQGSCTKHISD